MAFKKIVKEAPESIPQSSIEKNPMHNLFDAYMNCKIGYGKTPAKNKEKVENILRKNGYLL